MKLENKFNVNFAKLENNLLFNKYIYLKHSNTQ